MVSCGSHIALEGDGKDKLVPEMYKYYRNQSYFSIDLKFIQRNNIIITILYQLLQLDKLVLI